MKLRSLYQILGGGGGGGWGIGDRDGDGDGDGERIFYYRVFILLSFTISLKGGKRVSLFGSKFDLKVKGLEKFNLLQLSPKYGR